MADQQLREFPDQTSTFRFVLDSGLAPHPGLLAYCAFISAACFVTWLLRSSRSVTQASLGTSDDKVKELVVHPSAWAALSRCLINHGTGLT